jgi:hypothetical protein
VTRRNLAIGIMALLCVLVGAAWYWFEGNSQAGLIVLSETSLANVKDEFNRASDGARIIVLLSPT